MIAELYLALKSCEFKSFFFGHRMCTVQNSVAALKENNIQIQISTKICYKQELSNLHIQQIQLYGVPGVDVLIGKEKLSSQQQSFIFVDALFS